MAYYDLGFYCMDPLPPVVNADSTDTLSAIPATLPCFICGKEKGQPPDRCPGHYELTAERQRELEARVTAIEVQNIHLGPRRETEEDRLERGNQLAAILLEATKQFKEKRMTRCKFVCSWKQQNQNDDGVVLSFNVVTTGSDENKQFFKFTPGGLLQFYTVNAQAAAQFELGKEYYLDITPAE